MKYRLGGLIQYVVIRKRPTNLCFVWEPIQAPSMCKGTEAVPPGHGCHVRKQVVRNKDRDKNRARLP